MIQKHIMRPTLLSLAAVALPMAVLAAPPNSSSSPSIVGLQRTGGNHWEILFTGAVGVRYTLQESASLTSASWHDVGSSFLCQPGTNIVPREQPAPAMFWRIRDDGSSTQKLYITNMDEGTVTVVNRIDRSAIGLVSVGTNPALVGFISGLNRAYVSDLGAKSIHVIDTSTDTVLVSIALSRIVGGLDVDPVRRRVYALDHLDEGNPQHGGTNLLVIDASSYAKIADFPVGSNLQDIRVDSNAGRVYITDFVEGLKVLDSDDNSVLSTIPISGLAHGLAVDSARGLVYVTQVEAGTVSIVDLASDTVISTVSVGNDPEWVALDSAGAKAYVTNALDGTVSVVDTANRMVTSTLAVGAGAFYVIVDRHSGLAYVTNAEDNTVSVIDTVTDTVIDTITTGSQPVGLGLIP